MVALKEWNATQTKQALTYFMAEAVEEEKINIFFADLGDTKNN